MNCVIICYDPYFHGLVYLYHMAQKEEWVKEFIKDGYGSPEALAKILDLGVVMLFYLEEDTFSRREVQSVVEALKGIGEWLRETPGNES